VPEGQMTGISRKLPDTERTRLKAILRQVVPEDAGVIVRTAAEGATEDELTRDVIRLASQWEEIAHRARSSAANTPELLYGEPDLAIKVVRDIFNEDFTKLIVSGDDAWKTLEEYVNGVAPDLHDRLEKWTSQEDPFHVYRVDEQLTKALDRKVWLPSGGSLVIDRTEAMTVVDVNTGKFIGSGGNLEETVTKNNLEAAEEIVRQLRLRDIGGIIVVDFIDMVLENNRDLVLRRMLECLGRDRTKHQVAEVTSLGLVQMTRKRIGQGLLEVFSEPCEACNGRGVIVYADPVESKGPKVEQYEPQVVRPGAAASATAKIAAAGKRASDGSSSDAASDAVVADSDSANDGEASDSGRTGRSKRGRSGRRRGRGEDRDESAAGSDSTDEAPPQHSVAGTDSAPEPPTVPDRPTVPDTLATPELLSVPDTAVPAASSARIVTVASDRTDSLAEPVAASAGRPVRGSRRRAASRPAGPAAVDVSASSSEG
jgi:ribonuclease E